MLEEFIKKNELTPQNIRELVDDYSLLSYYIGAELEVNTSYSSPLRDDLTPSFSIFYGYGAKGSKDRLYFKDHTLGSGDVYKFLCLYFDAPLHKVLEQINVDLELGFGTGVVTERLVKSIIKPKPIIKERPKIRLVGCGETPEYLTYWKTLDISKRIRDRYRARCLSAWQYEYEHSVVTKTARDLKIGYSIGDRHKVYRPKAPRKKDKFRTDYLPNYVEGHLQLDWSRKGTLLITKATKECMFFAEHFEKEVQTVAGKSESTEIPEEFIRMYLDHFDNVVVWLDPDEAGERMMAIYKGKYGLGQRRTPSYVDQKDPTDMYTALGKDSLVLINRILNNE